MLEIQKYLQTQSIDTLQTELGIKVTPDSNFDNLKLFKYSQIDSPMSHPVVQEARGIILDSEQGYRPVCYGLNKFFNWQEGNAAKLKFSESEIYLKLDGSLMQLFWNPYSEKMASRLFRTSHGCRKRWVIWIHLQRFILENLGAGRLCPS